MADLPESGPTREQIARQVQKILRSRAFSDSPRSKKFLEYIVTERLNGGRGALKENVIAMEVFEKDSAFDARLLSTVRTGANRLRKKLRDYYQTEGQSDLISIDLAEGSYIPDIEFRTGQLNDEPLITQSSALQDFPAHFEPARTPAKPLMTSVGRLAGKGWRVIAASFTFEKMLSGGAIVTGVTASFCAAFTTAYAVAVLLFCLSAVFTIFNYSTVKDTPRSRVAVAVFVLAVMSYAPSAATLTELMDRVVNMATLPPASAYPFVTGLKFIPLFPVVFGYWIVLGLFGDVGFKVHRILGKTYLCLGIVCAFATWFVGITADPQSWYGQVPGSRNLWIGYAAILGLNLMVWFGGYRVFNTERISSYRGLLLFCGAGYIPLAIVAGLVDHQYNEINRHYLDIRHPDAYFAANPEVMDNLQGSQIEAMKGKMGPRLAGMFGAPDFRQTLRTGIFYRQAFDEAFQLGSHAVIFGYKGERRSDAEEPEFVIIRFPEEIAEALRFQPVPIRNTASILRRLPIE